MQFQSENHSPAALLSLDKAPQRVPRQARRRCAVSIGSHSISNASSSAGNSSRGIDAVINGLAKEWAVDQQARTSVDKVPKRVSRQLSAGSRGEPSLKMARRRFHQNNDIDSIIDNLPKDLAAKLDLVNDEEELPRSSGDRQIGSRASTRSSWMTRMSSISTAFSSMRSVVILGADLEDDNDSLDLSCFPRLQEDKDSSQPPRLPWRQSSCNTLTDNSKASSAKSNSLSKFFPNKTSHSKKKSKDTRPKKPWRQGLRLPGSRNKPEADHNCSATLRLSATSDFTALSSHSLDRELAMPVRQESFGSRRSATDLEGKKSFLKRQLKSLRRAVRAGQNHTKSHHSR